MCYQNPRAGSSPRWHAFDVDGWQVLVGRSASANDELSLRVAEPDDVWLHAAGYAGSHVVVRNPERLTEVPSDVVRRAAELAAWHSKARGARGKVEVHVCRARDVSKPRGVPPGQVRLRAWTSLKVYPRPEAP